MGLTSALLGLRNVQIEIYDTSLGTCHPMRDENIERVDGICQFAVPVSQYIRSVPDTVEG